MSDLIERKSIRNLYSCLDPEDKVRVAQVLIDIDAIPTIDAVEVVRCKDCKDIFFDDWYKCFSCANLYGLNEEVKPNDFCSHGERKESE